MHLITSKIMTKDLHLCLTAGNVERSSRKSSSCPKVNALFLFVVHFKRYPKIGILEDPAQSDILNEAFLLVHEVFLP